MLLDRLGLDYAIKPADIDETWQDGEAPEALVRRLAREKSEAVARMYREAGETPVIIGSDQVAVHDGKVLGKPGTEENARRQLRDFSGSNVIFMTAVCILDVESGRCEQTTDLTTVHFRELSDTEIQVYVEREQPMDCAGGFKAESLGIVLFDQIDSTDPTGLLGLPLIWVSRILAEFGIDALE